MNRPLAYISTAWSTDCNRAEKQAAQYCRNVYDAGYAPICPQLMYGQLLDDAVPAEHKDRVDMSNELLRRCRIVVFCGDEVDENVKTELALADRLRIASTTLDGIRKIKSAQELRH